MVVIRNRHNTKYSIGTVIKSSAGGQLLVTKYANNPAAAEHVKSMHDTYDKLAGSKLGKYLNIVKPIKTSDEEFTIPYIAGETLEHKLAAAIFSGNVKEFTYEVDKLYALINSVTENPGAQLPFQQKDDWASKQKEHLSPGIVDLNFDNIMVDTSGKWQLIDYEWCFDGTAPKDYIFGRALYWFFKKVSDSLRVTDMELVQITNDAVYVPEEIFKHYKDIFAQLEDILELEKKFQDYVAGAKDTFEVKAVSPEKYSPVASLLSEKHKDAHKMIDHLNGLVHAREEEIEHLKNRVNSIERSKSYKLAQKMSKASNKIRRK